MRLDPVTKVLIGAATLWPLAYMALFLLSFVGMATGGGQPLLRFEALFVLHLLTMVWMVGLMVFYIVYLFKTERVSQDKKVLWAIVLFMGHVIAMPIFFWLYIWPDPREGTP